MNHYIRYCDDFVIIKSDIDYLEHICIEVVNFLRNKLHLEFHPQKIVIRKLSQGIDFLGYVVLPHYKVLRTKTKNRMLKRASKKNLPSYLGLLSHCEGYKLEENIKENVDSQEL